MKNFGEKGAWAYPETAQIFLSTPYYLRGELTTDLENLEKSGNSNSKVVRGKSGKMEKVRVSEIRCVFQALNTPKLVLEYLEYLALAYDAPPDLLVGWGGEHPIPSPSWLQPQLFNN